MLSCSCSYFSSNGSMRYIGGANIARSSQFSTWLRKAFATRPVHEAPIAVNDDDLTRLAARPLHPLTLADLVR